LRTRWPTSEALAAAGVFLVCWGLVHTWFWGHSQIVDWPTYHDYGQAIVDHGLVPYRDFAVEYPPGALPVFIAPTPFDDYPGAFAWTMAICGVALVGVVAAIRREAAWYVALAPVLVGSLILSRFDLWPSLLLVAALAALLADRHRLGWALLGAAVAAKLWPLVVVPIALVWSIRRGRAASALYGAAVVVAAFLPFVVLSPGGVWDSISGQLSRPLQIESLGAAFLTTFGHPLVVTTHGSQNVAGHGAVAGLSAACGAATLAALWVAFARGPATRERVIRYSAAAVVAFVAFGKVLSPQYLLWLIPLVALVRGTRGIAAAVVLTAACVLTQIWFPFRYWQYVYGFHLAWVVLLRDLLFVALLVVLVWPGGLRPRELVSGFDAKG
jgi:uncharacterized membrane protein